MLLVARLSCLLHRRSGKIGVDFSLFDTTQGPVGGAATAAVGSSSFKFDPMPVHTSSTFHAPSDGGSQQPAAGSTPVAVPVAMQRQQQEPQQEQPPAMSSPFASRSQGYGGAAANGPADMV